MKLGRLKRTRFNFLFNYAFTGCCYLNINYYKTIDSQDLNTVDQSTK